MIYILTKNADCELVIIYGKFQAPGMDLKEVLNIATGVCKMDYERKASVMAMLEDNGFKLREETFRRFVLEFKGYEYLIAITWDSIKVALGNE